MSGSREEERLRALLRHVSDTISIFDTNGTVIWLGGNPGGTLGRADDDWLGENGFAHIHPDDREMLATKLGELLAEPGREVCADFRVRTGKDTWEYCEGVAVNRLHDPLIGGIVLTSRNITGRKQTERFLQQQTRILEGIASGAPIDSTLSRLVDLVQEAIAGSFCTVALDLPGTAHVDDPWCRVVSGVDDDVHFGLLVVAVDEPRPPSSGESAVLDAAGNLASIAVERSRSEERLRHMALHDGLTGLPNRMLLLDHLATAVRRISRHRTPVAVLFLDVDGFKKLNDTMGH
jgi:PAS domain S-box-containing protein